MSTSTDLRRKYTTRVEKMNLPCKYSGGGYVLGPFVPVLDLPFSGVSVSHSGGRTPCVPSGPDPPKFRSSTGSVPPPCGPVRKVGGEIVDSTVRTGKVLSSRDMGRRYAFFVWGEE